jgi:hypothetical protein
MQVGPIVPSVPRADPCHPLQTSFSPTSSHPVPVNPRFSRGGFEKSCNRVDRRAWAIGCDWWQARLKWPRNSGENLCSPSPYLPLGVILVLLVQSQNIFGKILS